MVGVALFYLIFMVVLRVCSQMVLQNVDKAEVKLRTKKDNVAGTCMHIP